MAIFRPGTSRPCGFSQKTCLPAATAAFEMHGMEMRSGGNQHHVDVALDQFLVGVEAEEAMLVVDRHLLGVQLLQPPAGPLQAIGEDVGHGHQPHVLAGVHGVGGRPAAASAAADQADLDHVAAGGVDVRPGQRRAAVRPPRRPCEQLKNCRRERDVPEDLRLVVMVVSPKWVTSGDSSYCCNACPLSPWERS